MICEQKIRVTRDHAPTNYVEALHDRLLGVNKLPVDDHGVQTRLE